MPARSILPQSAAASGAASSMMTEKKSQNMGEDIKEGRTWRIETGSFFEF
jgi:hypothetical protein